jgi:hypothetical protein
VILTFSLLLIAKYNKAGAGLSPNQPANQTGKESGGAREEPGVCSVSPGVSNSWNQASHATATIGAKPADIVGWSSGIGPT